MDTSAYAAFLRGSPQSKRVFNLDVYETSKNKTPLSLYYLSESGDKEPFDIPTEKLTLTA
jgi:hypothetical protein